MTVSAGLVVGCWTDDDAANIGKNAENSASKTHSFLFFFSEHDYSCYLTHFQGHLEVKVDWTFQSEGEFKNSEKEKELKYFDPYVKNGKH